MKCPRCGSWLREIEPGPRWMRHFACDECWSIWHPVRYKTGRQYELCMERGRELRSEAAA
jgi:hypothetical protein